VRALLALPLLASTALAAPADGGVTDGGAAALASLRDALARCGPGDALAPCVAGLRAAGVEAKLEGGRALVPLGAPFYAVVVDAREGTSIVDVAFRASAVSPSIRHELVVFLDEHAGAYPFSEPCREGAAYCGVFYPKQKGGAAGVEVGVGLVGVVGKSVWRRPPVIKLEEGQRVYAKDERLLDVERTASAQLVVQFSLPLDAHGRPSGAPQLLRPAFEAFARSVFVRLP
jgi:hypothetical protein